MIHSKNSRWSEVLLILYYFLGFAAAQWNAPVFLWGKSVSELRPSLITVSETEFKEMLTPLLAEKSMVVFTEKEAFECPRLNSIKSQEPSTPHCHQYLSELENKQYLASVENPLEVLRSLDGKQTEEIMSLRAEDILKLSLDEVKPNKVYFVQLPEEESSTVRQDGIIASVAEYLEGKAFFIYTSSVNPEKSSGYPQSSIKLQRSRRQAAGNDQKKIFDEPGLLLYTQSVNVVANGEEENLTISGMSVKANASKKVILNVTLNTSSGSPLTFDIINEAGYYTMYNLKYKDIVYISGDINAPLDFSYYCGDISLLEDRKKQKTARSSYSRLYWKELQFQAFFDTPAQGSKQVFSDAWHCSGFFSTGILMSLLVLIFIMAVTFTGIAWLMDIRTMDRFDDPKGKTITINTSE